MTQTIVSFSFFRFDSIVARLWAFAMMGTARAPLAETPDIGFWKLFGSGSGEGFTPVPNTGVYAILATWPDINVAQERIAHASIFSRYKEKADESWTVFLNPTSARGKWAGTEPFATTKTSADGGPVAILTRATVKPRAAMRFWQRVPNISDVIGNDENVRFKIGVGEVPWLQQVTFSIWPSLTSMHSFAHKDGPHARAIRAVRDGDWFQEELYARFAVIGTQGSWSDARSLETTEISQ